MERMGNDVGRSVIRYSRPRLGSPAGGGEKETGWGEGRCGNDVEGNVSL